MYRAALGDNSYAIAAHTYQNAYLWIEIYTVNRTRTGPDPDRINVGLLLALPCQNGTTPDPLDQVVDVLSDTGEIVVQK